MIDNIEVYGQALLNFAVDVTLAGGPSPYGTVGQGGNVFEWEETDFDLVNDSTSSLRGIRGGGVLFDAFLLSASARLFFNPADEDGLGFRVASVPEPSSLLLGVLGAVGLLVWRKVLR